MFYVKLLRKRKEKEIEKGGIVRDTIYTRAKAGRLAGVARSSF
jgi:hypothetical protein